MAEQDVNSDALAKDLWEAVDDNDVVKVGSLLERADPNCHLYWSDSWVYNGDPPLHHACSLGYLEIVKTLVTHGARTDMTDGEGQLPLDRALNGPQDGDCGDVALYLMSCGCVCGDEDKAKLLHAACHYGNRGVVQKLVELHKVDPKNVRRDGKSPLDKALDRKYLHDCVNVAFYLMSCGCTCGDEDKDELLSAACCHGILGMVKELAEQHKVDPKNVRDSDKYNSTPLHDACFNGRKDVVQYLVEKAECDINATDNQGKTPLDYATWGSNTEIADYLKSQGSNFGSDDDDGPVDGPVDDDELGCTLL